MLGRFYWSLSHAHNDLLYVRQYRLLRAGWRSVCLVSV